MPQMESAPCKGTSGRVEIFEYPAGPGASSIAELNGWECVEEEAPSPNDVHAHKAGGRAIEMRSYADFEQRLAEETRCSYESGRERGQQEGRQAEREVQAASSAGAEQERKRQAAGLIESFTLERERYLQKVEHEVVKLALAIAARILRREAQMDPLLLTGAVRVALGQLSGSTEVRLRVPELELELWTEAIALLPNLAVKPTVTVGEGMRLGDCVVETQLGSVDLGVRAQLGEIERGFFDRAGGLRTKASKTEAVAAAPVGATQGSGA